MRFTRAALAAVTAAALAASAACGGAPGKEDPASDQAQLDDRTAIGDATDPKAKAPAPDVEGAQKGGTLTINTKNAPSTVDPTRSYYVDSTAILRLVTRGLTQYKYDPKSKGMVLVPDMATNLGEPNKDFTEWKFTLRDGLKYDDGSNVKAEDVAYAIKRQFAISELPEGPTYGLDYFKGGDKYKGPYKDGENFEGVETPNDKTVVVKMRKPFPDMMYYASFPNFTGIPKDKDTKSEYEKDGPMATGPYKFEKYTPGKQLVLTKNEHWDPKTDPVRHQYPDKFEFNFGEDNQTLQDKLVLDKGVDQTSATYDNVLASDLPDINGKEPEQRLVKGRDSCIYYAYMDMRKIPLKVRKAIATAYPLESIRKVGETIPNMTAYPATTLMSSTVPGWEDTDAVGREGLGDGNAKKAKQMLKEAGEENFQLTWYYTSDDPNAQKVNQAKKEAMTEAGFKVKDIGVTTEQSRELMAKVDTKTNMLNKGWCADWPSGGSIFPAQWDYTKSQLEGAPNPSFPTKKTQDIKDEIDRISKLPSKKALGEWGKLDSKLMKKYLPVVPEYQSGNAFLHGSKVHNYNVDEVLGMPDFSQVWVEQ